MIKVNAIILAIVNGYEQARAPDWLNTSILSLAYEWSILEWCPSTLLKSPLPYSAHLSEADILRLAGRGRISFLLDT